MEAMIVTDAQGGRVLIQSQGNIVLFVEPESSIRGWPRVLVRNLPAVAALFATVMLAALIGVVVHERALAQERQALLEERLLSQIRTLDERLQSALAGQENRLALRSDRLAEHVDVVGGRIVEEVAGVSGKVDVLPSAIDKTLQGRAGALIGWLSAVGPHRSGTAPLTIHSAETRAARRKSAN